MARACEHRAQASAHRPDARLRGASGAAHAAGGRGWKPPHWVAELYPPRLGGGQGTQTMVPQGRGTWTLRGA